LPYIIVLFKPGRWSSQVPLCHNEFCLLTVAFLLLSAPRCGVCVCLCLPVFACITSIYPKHLRCQRLLVWLVRFGLRRVTKETKNTKVQLPNGLDHWFAFHLVCVAFDLGTEFKTTTVYGSTSTLDRAFALGPALFTTPLSKRRQ
jgi:hypothetical protein